MKDNFPRKLLNFWQNVLLSIIFFFQNQSPIFILQFLNIPFKLMQNIQIWRDLITQICLATKICKIRS